jgi:Flp pilus assembly protein TadG
MRFLNLSHNSKKQTGAVLIEFAIVAPVLFLILVGIIEFSYAFYHWNILNKSVENGARFLSTPLIARTRNGSLPALNNPINLSATNSTNLTKMANLVIYGNTSIPSPCLSSTTPPCPLLPNLANYSNIVAYCVEEGTVNKICLTTTQHIQVTASYSHAFIMGNALKNLMNSAIPDTLLLTASATLRIE